MFVRIFYTTFRISWHYVEPRAILITVSEKQMFRENIEHFVLQIFCGQIFFIKHKFLIFFFFSFLYTIFALSMRRAIILRVSYRLRTDVSE